MVKKQLFPILTLVLLSVSPTFAQSPVITFYETGSELRFEAADILGIQSVDAERNDQAVVAVGLTTAMSQRLHMFTNRLVGRDVMMLGQNHVLMTDTTVQTAISGPVIHFADSAAAVTHRLAEGLKELAGTVSNTEEPMFVAYEQVSKLVLDASHAMLFQDGVAGNALILRVSAYDGIADASPTESGRWIAVIDQYVVDDWSISNQDGVIDITLGALTPTQHALLLSSLDGAALTSD